MLDKIRERIRNREVWARYSWKDKKVKVNGEKMVLKADGKLDDYIVRHINNRPELAEHGIITEVGDERIEALLKNKELMHKLMTQGKTEITRKKLYPCDRRAEIDSNPEVEVKCRNKTIHRESVVPAEGGALAGWLVAYDESIEHWPDYDLFAPSTDPEKYRVKHLSISNPAGKMNHNPGHYFYIKQALPLDCKWNQKPEDYSEYKVHLSYGEDNPAYETFQFIDAPYDPKTGKIHGDCAKEVFYYHPHHKGKTPKA